ELDDAVHVGADVAVGAVGFDGGEVLADEIGVEHSGYPTVRSRSVPTTRSRLQAPSPPAQSRPPSYRKTSPARCSGRRRRQGSTTSCSRPCPTWSRAPCHCTAPRCPF